jgi:ribosomal protein S18 acetylase RimI-like enzyme
MSRVSRTETGEAAERVSAHFDVITREVLSRGSCLRFQARGMSMYPFIQDGDIVLVEPGSIDALKIGDVVFCRRPDGSYFMHRLVKKRGTATFWTKGDNSPHYDHPVPAEQALGKVIAIERDGRYLRLDRGLNKAISRVWGRLSPRSRRLRPVLRPFWRLYRALYLERLSGLAGFCLVKVQALSPYRRFARNWRRGIVYREAGAPDAPQLLRWFGADRSESPDAADKDTTCFVAARGDRIIGSVDLVRRPGDSSPHGGHWLFSLIVHPLYRGRGIGEALTLMVMARSKKEGAAGLSLLVFEHNRPAVGLYRKLGFEIKVVPKLERQLEEERRRHGRRRILMYASLAGKDG